MFVSPPGGALEEKKQQLIKRLAAGGGPTRSRAALGTSRRGSLMGSLTHGGRGAQGVGAALRGFGGPGITPGNFQIPGPQPFDFQIGQPQERLLPPQSPGILGQSGQSLSNPFIDSLRDYGTQTRVHLPSFGAPAPTSYLTPQILDYLGLGPSFGAPRGPYGVS